MKYLKKFNESIKRKDIKEVIDDILDNLSSKKKLSNSEKEFMVAASKNEIKDVTVPNMTGDFWSDMSNPHNLGIMWIGKDGVWKLLKSIEDEEIDRLEKSGNSDDVFNFKKKKKQESIIEEFPELKPILLELAKIKIENLERERIVMKKLNDFESKIKDSDKKYDIGQRLDYAKKDIYSLENQFGYVLPELKMDDDGEYSLSK
jgi:hypothetical protein